MRRQPWWFAPVLTVFAVAGIVAEISVLIWGSGLLGFWPNLAVMTFFTGVGIWLTRREGKKVWGSLLAEMSAGRVPTGSLADGALVMAGGALLILPGYLSDLLGLLLLLPFTRPVIRSGLGYLLSRWIAPSNPQPDVIGGEVVEERPNPQPDDQEPPIRGQLTD